ncbi:hypothetical protein PT300_12430 [Enterobacteriaceae bacterium ESL0689]|nr:hypothetical protein [Enterobacteriaceae bacterium ESL0689]
MFSFKNEATGMFFGMSLQIYSDMFNLADEDTQRVIYTKVMDPEFINSFIGLANKQVWIIASWKNYGPCAMPLKTPLVWLAPAFSSAWGRN